MSKKDELEKLEEEVRLKELQVRKFQLGEEQKEINKIKDKRLFIKILISVIVIGLIFYYFFNIDIFSWLS